MKHLEVTVMLLVPPRKVATQGMPRATIAPVKLPYEAKAS